MLGGLNLQAVLCLGNGVEWDGKGVFKEERDKRSSFPSYQKRVRITVTRVFFPIKLSSGFRRISFSSFEP